MKEPLTLFGKRLRSLRKSANLSQKQLGIMIGLDDGVASARMNQYEVGSHSPKFSTATKIADTLGVSAAYFYAEDQELSELIIEYSRMDSSNRNKLLRSIKQI